MRQARSSYTRQNSSNSDSKIWWILGAIIAILLGLKFFYSGNSTTNEVSKWDYITIIPGEKSVVAIADKNLKETTITKEENLFITDNYVSVSEWSAIAKVKTSNIDLDEKTQISYISSNIDSENIKLEKWRAWVDSSWNTNSIELKRMTVKIPSGSIALVEQTNTAFSVAYAIQWNIDISTTIGQYTLKPGQWIKLSDSNLTSEQTKLSDLVDEIDASIVNNPVFARNNWEEILKNATKNQETTETITTENSATGSTEANTSSKYISFTQPSNNLNSKTDTINVMWTILDDEVARVTINDIDTVVSPVNQTFSLQNFKLNSEVNNIVYKVYNANWIQLEIGVIVVYGPKNTGTQTTIVPQNYPINSADFRIINKNPLATTDSYVRVEWTVPKNTVEYITVNDYRLQKFIPNTEKWYYHANADIGTIKEWTNLYYIKFFDKNNKLLYTQLFTIIKDSKSNTITNENSSLFPQ